LLLLLKGVLKSPFLNIIFTSLTPEREKVCFDDAISNLWVNMSHLALINIRKAFGEKLALHDLSFEVGPGEILGVTGPSGAGKTTMCRIIAGIESPSEGEVYINNVKANGLPPQHRAIALMFESYALHPHFTVFDNIAFPLRSPRLKGRYKPEEIKTKIMDIMRFAEIEELQERFPSELSGGQKQRVALCRALIQDCNAYVLDEPISHLDAKLNYRLRGDIRRRLTGSQIPTIWVSPNALEVLSVSDRVVVLVEGKVQQFGSPREILRHPESTEVARLVGDPPMNLIKGNIETEGGKLIFKHSAFTASLPPTVRDKLENGKKRHGVILGIPPTQITMEEPKSDNAIEGEVYVYEPFCKYSILSVRLGEDVIKIKMSAANEYRQGQMVCFRVNWQEVVVFDNQGGKLIAEGNRAT
jgi:multiple sugar transport system ATP-binding protein